MARDGKTTSYSLGLCLTRFILAFFYGLVIDAFILMFFLLRYRIKAMYFGDSESMLADEKMETLWNVFVAIPLIWGVLGIFFFDSERALDFY